MDGWIRLLHVLLLAVWFESEPCPNSLGEDVDQQNKTNDHWAIILSLVI